MEQRVCPGCGQHLHSSNKEDIWTCPRCAADVPIPGKNESIDRKSDTCPQCGFPLPPKGNCPRCGFCGG